MGEFVCNMCGAKSDAEGKCGCGGTFEKKETQCGAEEKHRCGCCG